MIILNIKLIQIFIFGIVVVLGYLSLYYGQHILWNQSFGKHIKLSNHIEIYPALIQKDLNTSYLTPITNSYIHVALHEFGHYVWFELDKELRKKYCNNVYLNSNYLTDYSKKNCEEHFAEYFAMFKSDKQWFLLNDYITHQEKKFFLEIIKI